MTVGTLRQSYRLLILFCFFLLSVGLWYAVHRAIEIEERNSAGLFYRAHGDITKAILHTDKGDITIEFDKDNAPRSVEYFMSLTEKGFYDLTRFHKILPGLSIEGGDPLSRTQNESRYGSGRAKFLIPKEVNDTPIVAGSVVFDTAPADPEHYGGMFIIYATDAEVFNDRQDVFARVVDGLDVVTTISKTPTKSHGVPIQYVKLNSVELK